MSEKSAVEYMLERERAAQPKRVAALTEIERAALGPAALRAMLDSEQARDSIDEKNRAAAATAAAARAELGKLPSWIQPKQIGYDHKNLPVELEADHAPLALGDGRVLLRLTQRRPRVTPGQIGGGSYVAVAKLGASVHSLEPGESRWLACGGLLKVPAGKSVVVWALHRPAKVALNDPDLSRGFILGNPRQYGPGYVGEIVVNFANAPDMGQMLQLSLGQYIALAELVES